MIPSGYPRMDKKGCAWESEVVRCGNGGQEWYWHLTKDVRPLWQPCDRHPHKVGNECGVWFCNHLALKHAPEFLPIVLVDFMDDPQVEKRILIQTYKTGGGGHNWGAYALQGISLDQLKDFLVRNPPVSDLRAEIRNGELVLRSSFLGPLIGSKGRWAKAYRTLGLRVRFEEVKSEA